MINDFLQSIKGQLAGKLAGQGDVSSSKADEASETITNTVKDGIAEKAGKGQIDDIMGLLGKGGASTGFASDLVRKVSANLSARVGLSPGVASKIASFAVPFVINKLGEFTSAKGKDNKGGIQEMMGDLMKGSFKDNLPGGLGKKFGL